MRMQGLFAGIPSIMLSRSGPAAVRVHTLQVWSTATTAKQAGSCVPFADRMCAVACWGPTLGFLLFPVDLAGGWASSSTRVAACLKHR